MLTLGIDLASQNAKTAVSRVEWRTGEARVEAPELGGPGEDIEWLIERVSAAIEVNGWVGIDAPFGWPEQMVRAVWRHAKRRSWPAPHKDELRYRLTDRRVRERYQVNPLSVSSDWIAVPAWRCAALIDNVRPDLGFVRRTGEDRIVEVYPGAALKVWRFKQRRAYKSSGNAATRKLRREQRGRLLRELERRAGWIKWGDDARERCLYRDDALDAVLCAFIARATATDRTRWPEESEIELARVEGWIHVPEAECFDRLPWGRVKSREATP